MPSHCNKYPGKKWSKSKNFTLITVANALGPCNVGAVSIVCFPLEQVALKGIAVTYQYRILEKHLRMQKYRRASGDSCEHFCRAWLFPVLLQMSFGGAMFTLVCLVPGTHIDDDSELHSTIVTYDKSPDGLLSVFKMSSVKSVVIC